MKKKNQISLLLSLLLIFSLLLCSCNILLPPSDGSSQTPIGGTENGPQGTNQDQKPNDTTGNGQENNSGNTEKDETEYVPPVIVNPPAPDFGDEDDTFGEYTVYYLLDTDGDRFTLKQIQLNENGELRAAVLCGVAEINDNGGYTLYYDGGEIGYGKYKNGVFCLTNEDFSAAEDHDSRGGDGVTEIAITPSQGGTDFGYRDLANLKNGKGMQAFYRELLEECKIFASSTRSIENTADYYKICELNFAKHGIDADQAKAVWSLLRMENPIFYWLSSVCYYTPTTFYLTVDEEYASYSVRAEYDRDIQDMITEARACISDAMNDVERALAIHDYLLSIMDYAYIPGTRIPEDSVWAHNIIGAASIGKGVCETYAKTYQLLMQQIGIPTLYVTGYAGEAHAWNLVYLSGEWVGVDATWNDMGDGAYLTSYFGLGASALAKDHTQDPVGGVGTAYHYKTPTVSPLGLSLVTLSKNNEAPRIYASIDAALRTITDEQASYLLSFYNYTEYGAYMVNAPSVYYYTTLSELPTAASLTVKGEFYTSASPYAAELHLLSPSLNINAPLILEGIHLTEAHGTHRGVTLTAPVSFGGKECGITLSYFGRQDGKGVAKVTASAHLSVRANLNLSELILTGNSPELELAEGEMHIERLTLSGETSLPIRLSPTDTTLYLYREVSAHLNLLLDGGEDAHLGAKKLLVLTPESRSISFAVFTARGNGWRERTDYFTLSEENEVVLRALSVLNGMTLADGILLSYHGQNSTFSLPSEVHSIGACAFADYSGNEIAIPEGILYLRRGALEHSSLEYITLPETLCIFDTTLSDYTVLAPVKRYDFPGSYADWARIVAVSDLVLYYYTTPATVTCEGGKALTSNPINKQGEGLALRAVSGVVREITSVQGIRGKRMHLIDYDEDGTAVLVTFDVYSSGAYGEPTRIASLSMTKLGEGRYTFTHKGKAYYITITNNSFIYTNQNGEPVADYPT